MRPLEVRSRVRRKYASSEKFIDEFRESIELRICFYCANIMANTTWTRHHILSLADSFTAAEYDTVSPPPAL